MVQSLTIFSQVQASSRPKTSWSQHPDLFSMDVARCWFRLVIRRLVHLATHVPEFDALHPTQVQVSPTR